MLYDGDCRFCRQWVERWRVLTGPAIDYRPYQEAGALFPEIPTAELAESVHLILPNGVYLRGAAAVWTTLQGVWFWKWAGWLCRRSHWASELAEWAYRLVARHRVFFSRLTWLLWGRSPLPSTYRFSSWLFPRAVGVVAGAAFVSLGIQMAGLVGEDGLLPAGRYFEAVREALINQGIASHPGWYLPSIFWWRADNVAIFLVLAMGGLASLGMILGLLPPLSAWLAWAAYLSLVAAGQVFLNFQWDALLLAALFLCIGFGPWRLIDRWAGHRAAPVLARWLVWLLLFALLFESGIVKWQSFRADGGNDWRALTALRYHFWTQPMPNPASWWIDRLPEWFDRGAVALLLFIEIVLPFGLAGPRRVRHVAAGGQILLQAGIILSGHYGYFNWLTMALCIPLLDDRVVPDRVWKIMTALSVGPVATPPPPAASGRTWIERLRQGAVLLTACIFIPVTTFQIIAATESPAEERPSAQWLRAHPWLQQTYDWTARFRTVNPYGLFRVMTRTRPEILLWGSRDGRQWEQYDFKYKVSDPRQAPPVVWPGHMPRLDWQMWFAALHLEATGQIPGWMSSLLGALAENRPAVSRLLLKNPFAGGEPPVYFRIELYQYRFATAGERRTDGVWWVRTKVPGRSREGRWQGPAQPSRPVQTL